MKKLRLSFIFLILCFTGIGQNVQRSSLSSSGSSKTVEVAGTSYYISHSVGQQSAIGTLQSNNNTIRQGFQQPPASIKVYINDTSNLSARIFPNPVEAFVTIAFNDVVKNPIQIELFNIAGKHILSKKQAPTNSFQLDISQLASGTYLLTLVSGSKKLTAKLIKK